MSDERAVLRSAEPVGRRRSTTHPSISEHLRQRRAVAALKERLHVRVISSRYGGGEMISARVSVDGEFYDVRPHELELLRQGQTPEGLALEPIPSDEDV